MHNCKCTSLEVIKWYRNFQPSFWSLSLIINDNGETYSVMYQYGYSPGCQEISSIRKPTPTQRSWPSSSRMATRTPPYYSIHERWIFEGNSIMTSVLYSHHSSPWCTPGLTKCKKGLPQDPPHVSCKKYAINLSSPSPRRGNTIKFLFALKFLGALGSGPRWLTPVCSGMDRLPGYYVMWKCEGMPHFRSGCFVIAERLKPQMCIVWARQIFF